MRLGDILMFLLVVPVVLSLLFLNDNFFMLRKAFLLVGITCFFRPITFCCTSLPDPCPSSLSNQYPFHPLPCLLHATPNRQSDPHPKADDAFRYMLQRIVKPSDYSTSGDMIFSGHTRLVIMSITVGSLTESNLGSGLSDHAGESELHDSALLARADGWNPRHVLLPHCGCGEWLSRSVVCITRWTSFSPSSSPRRCGRSSVSRAHWLRFPSSPSTSR